MPELERLMLHRLAELDGLVRQAYADFDYKRIFAALNAFMTIDLSAFYFDIRKDALYCDPISSTTRKACLTVLDQLFRATVTWLAPMLPFTAEEAWLARYPVGGRLRASRAVSPSCPPPGATTRWRRNGARCGSVRRVVTGAIEIERAQKRIGSSLEAAPVVYVSDPDLFAAMVDIDLAEVSITSAATLVEGEGPPDAFRLDEVKGVAVEVRLAAGHANARGRGRSCRASAPIRPIPTSPRATPRRCASGTRCARRRSEPATVMMRTSSPAMRIARLPALGAPHRLGWWSRWRRRRSIRRSSSGCCSSSISALAAS